jgi:hypothetical protein
LPGAAFHRRRNRGHIRHIDDVGKSLAAFGGDLCHRVVGRFLVDIDASHRSALAREQHRHRAAVTDGRILVDDLALAGADHDDAACPSASACSDAAGSRRFGTWVVVDMSVPQVFFVGIVAVQQNGRASFTSLRANGSRECAPDDRLREAIHGCCRCEWIASSLRSSQ